MRCHVTPNPLLQPCGFHAARSSPPAEAACRFSPTRPLRRQEHLACRIVPERPCPAPLAARRHGPPRRRDEADSQFAKAPPRTSRVHALVFAATPLPLLDDASSPAKQARAIQLIAGYQRSRSAGGFPSGLAGVLRRGNREAGRSIPKPRNGKSSYSLVPRVVRFVEDDVIAAIEFTGLNRQFLLGWP